MQYFIRNAERNGTCYHEFAHGSENDWAFWRDDSIYLHDDVLCEHVGFAEAIKAAIPEYNPCGPTKVTRTQWAQIGATCRRRGGATLKIFAEADAWVQTALESAECFMILGI